MEFAKVKKCAAAVVKGTGKLLEIAETLSVKLDPLVKVPIVGDTVAEVQDIVYMLNDYYRGNYKELPVTVIIGCAAVVLYLASPIDLIPDNIPILGFIDDALIINFLLDMCIEKELDKYREWKKAQ